MHHESIPFASISLMVLARDRTPKELNLAAAAHRAAQNMGWANHLAIDLLRLDELTLLRLGCSI